MKWILLSLLMCSGARARPAPPPQVIYVTNYVFTTNFIVVSGVVTNLVNTTNYLNTTNFVFSTNGLLFSSGFALTNQDNNQDSAFNVLLNALPTPGHKFYTLSFLRNQVSNDAAFSNALEVLGSFTLLHATNVFNPGWPYGGGGVDAVSGETISTFPSMGNYVAVFGFSQAKGATQVGTSGFVDTMRDGQTNAGIFGSVTLDGHAADAGSYAGGYFELMSTTPQSLPAQAQSAVIVADNRDTGLPIQLWGTSNGTYVGRMDSDGTLTICNLVILGNVTLKGSGPGLIQTFSGTNVTGHLP